MFVWRAGPEENLPYNQLFEVIMLIAFCKCMNILAFCSLQRSVSLFENENVMYLWKNRL